MPKVPSWDPMFHSTTVNTSPDRLGLEEGDELEGRESTSPPGSRVKRFSTAVVDKLSRSRSARSPPGSPPSSSGPRRVFSLKGKNKQRNDDGSPSSTPSASRPTSPRQSSNDDSPFISPDPPPAPAGRPTLSSWRGEGSMRVGTQTLIQALQALPWTPDPDDDDAVNQATPSSESDSDEDTLEPLSSSIHTIYRPVARSRRLSLTQTRTPSILEDDGQHQIHEPPQLDEEEEDTEGEEDFEEATPRPVDLQPAHVTALKGHPSDGTLTAAALSRMQPMRTGSMATVKLQRQTRLAEKLREIFDLPTIDEVRAEMPCWLLRSILLQGYMYLTNSYLCFFAHMPSREDQVLKSGSLYKKAQRTKRWIKHWFVLKNDALRWYQSSSDPYFPHGIIDLRYAISCEPVGEKDFRVKTNNKIIHLSADSVPSREEWVKAIKKVIFKAQNMGDSVKIAIPYSAIVDVDRSSAMDFSETIEVKVLDTQPEASQVSPIDSYFFAYFHDLPGAIDQIRSAVRLHRSLNEHLNGHTVLDTTNAREREREKQAIVANASSSSFKLPNLPNLPNLRILRPFQETRAMSSPETHQEDFTHISRRTNSESFIPVTNHASPGDSSASTLTPTATVSDHTYPPVTTSTSAESSSSWSGWLRSSISFNGVKEIYSSSSAMTPTTSRWGGDLAFSTLEVPEGSTVDEDMTQKFRSAFAYDERETLLGYFPGYIYRLLPVFGRLYISTNYFCFKSSGPLTSRTRMALPIRDILATENSKGTRFGHYGLIIIIRGHEELFFEFGAEDRRRAFVALLTKQVDDSRHCEPPPSASSTKPLILDEEPVTPPPDAPTSENSLSDSQSPAIMFTSASSTFLTFKPQKSLHFTFLTIGSRGDVQPYIALSKGLIADGHKCKIATHGEFKEWIESHGIEYGYVGGDPAELMRICVENGMFTLSFMKEGLQKFRGWLDDLLKTSWNACQGTDVLIESPSAMGGYHIAEALGIPYFRAFTMTWTRTRAYPHAFAVPDRKMGGSYNYMSYVMFDQVFWRAISGQINRWRRNVLGLGSTSFDKMETHKIPFLYNFSPCVVPPPLDWPEWIRVTGYWFLEDADVSSKKWTPPVELDNFINGAHKKGKKVVYIGFGSIVVSDPRAMTRCVIEAVVQSGVYAILSKGWSDRLQKPGEMTEAEEPLPPQIYPITSIPHDWLFQRIDAACHHGGAGTTGASLRAGIPTIIRPFFGDQFFWADRVEALGVGSGVRKLTVETLRDALTLATTDPKQIDRAKLIGERIRREDGVATAIESIYRDLEYARSLVKRPAVQFIEDEEDDDIAENGTIRRRQSRSGYSSGGAPSEDWSVISSDDERRSSFSSRNSRSRERTSKRNSLAAAVLSVIPDAFTPSSPRKSTISTGSNS